MRYSKTPHRRTKQYDEDESWTKVMWLWSLWKRSVAVNLSAMLHISWHYSSYYFIDIFFSFINVIIYNVRDQSFRTSVKELFYRNLCCQKLRVFFSKRNRWTKYYNLMNDLIWFLKTPLRIYLCLFLRHLQDKIKIHNIDKKNVLEQNLTTLESFPVQQAT